MSPKLFTTLLMLAVTFNMFAQLGRLHGTWISDSLDAFSIDSADEEEEPFAGRSRISNAARSLTVESRMDKDTLDFVMHFAKNINNDFVRMEEHYTFLILSNIDSSLVLKPNSDHARDFFAGQPAVSFKRQAYVNDISIQFDKLYFSVISDLFCDMYNYRLQVNSNRQVLFIADFVNKLDDKGTCRTDTASQGYFIGRMSEPVYTKLVQAIQSSNIKSYRLNKQYEFGNTAGLVILYNKTQRLIAGWSLPLVFDNLFEILLDFCKHHRLQKVKKMVNRSTTQKFDRQFNELNTHRFP